MRVSINGGTSKSSTLIGFSLINHPFWGTPIYGNPLMLFWDSYAPWCVFFPVKTSTSQGPMHQRFCQDLNWRFLDTVVLTPPHKWYLWGKYQKTLWRLFGMMPLHFGLMVCNLINGSPQLGYQMTCTAIQQLRLGHAVEELTIQSQQ